MFAAAVRRSATVTGALRSMTPQRRMATHTNPQEPERGLTFTTFLGASLTMIGGMVAGAVIANRGAEFLDKGLGLYHHVDEDEEEEVDDDDDDNDAKESDTSKASTESDAEDVAAPQAAPSIFGVGSTDAVRVLSAGERVKWYIESQQKQLELLQAVDLSAAPQWEKDLLMRTTSTLHTNLKSIKKHVQN